MKSSVVLFDLLRNQTSTLLLHKSKVSVCYTHDEFLARNLKGGRWG